MQYDVRMTCKGCVFAKVENGEQTDCYFKRPEKLGASEKVDGFYQFDRVCNLSRPKEWLEEIPSGEEYVYRALREIRPKVGVVITFEDDLGALDRTLATMSNQLSANFKYVIVINQKVEYNDEINALFKKYFKVDTTCHLVQLLVDADHNESLDHAFRFAKNGYIALVKAGYEFHHTFLARIDFRINQELKRLLVAADDNREKILVYTPLWKFLNGNRPKMLEGGEMDNRGFFEKLADIEQTDADSLIRWEDLFNENT